MTSKRHSLGVYIVWLKPVYCLFCVQITLVTLLNKIYIGFFVSFQVPWSLVDNFLKEQKNAISCLMEFSAITKIKTEFKECAVKTPSMTNRYSKYSILKHSFKGDYCL